MMKGFCCVLKTHYLANTGIVFKIVCFSYSRFCMGYLRKTTKIVKYVLIWLNKVHYYIDIQLTRNKLYLTFPNPPKFSEVK